MTKRLRVHFDGKVLVPEEPVDLPLGESFVIELREEPPPPKGSVTDAIAQFIKDQPAVDRGDMPTDGSINYKHYLYGHSKNRDTD